MTKDWDQHVVDAEEVARTAGFGALRDRIVAMAEIGPDDVVVDVGSGTGLLTLAAAPLAQEVWAIDIASSMGEYLRAKAASAGCSNITCATASAASLPLVDGCADVVISNYCLHHLDDPGKRRALDEAYRVLRPGGRIVFGDMMFRVTLGDPRDRRVVAQKVRAMVQKGPAGVVRLARNGARLASGRWEHPARGDWWEQTLREAGFVDSRVELLDHEGGIGIGTKPRG